MSLKDTYQYVIEALLKANQELDRSVSAPEASERLPSHRREELEEQYAGNLTKTVSDILRRLRDRDRIVSPGKAGRHRYYCATEWPPADHRSSEQLLPSTWSLREKVRRLVRSAADRLERAVRLADLKEELNRLDGEFSVPENKIANVASGLDRTGDLQVVGVVRGDGRGRKLYLPPDLDPDEYRPREPLTWLGEVEEIVRTLWRERSGRARAAERKPQPLATGDVRGRLREDSPHHPRLENPQLLVNALRQLATGDNSRIRAVDRGADYRFKLWVPVEVTDEEVDLEAAWAADTERLETAVVRAEERASWPAVPLDKVQKELEKDPELQPRSDAPLHRLIGDVVKETVGAGTGERRQRVDQRVWKVGKVKGHAYYCTNAPEMARHFVRYRRLRERWNDLKGRVRLAHLKGCRLHGAALGRAMLLEAETSELLDELVELLEEAHLPETWSFQLDELRRQVAGVVGDVNTWLEQADTKNFPGEVDRQVPGWTPAQLKEALRPYYPLAEDGTPADMVRAISHAIRRVPNPDYQSRRSGEHATATEFLFDRAAALIHAAFRWGNHEVRVQATMARDELGQLRDSSFLFPHLRSDDLEDRVRAVACLAILGGDCAKGALESVVEEDPIPAVREAARRGRRFLQGESLKVSEPTEWDLSSTGMNERTA